MGATSRFHEAPLTRYQNDRAAEIARFRSSTNPMQQACIANEIARLDFHIERVKAEQYAVMVAAEDQDVDF
jgi:hypothetical protein